MKIHNIRQGFAANSSSSHSILFVDDVSRIEDNFIDNNYGWDEFIIASQEEKDNYLAAQILSQFSNDNNFRQILYFINGFFCKDMSHILGKDIDHQSLWSLPVSKDSKETAYPDVEFLIDLREYLNRENIIIVGSNDNTNISNEDIIGRPCANTMLDEFIFRGNKLIARKDGIYWVLFNQSTGDKIRFSFNDNAPEYTKSSTPELIDLNITNICHANCSFCYRDCTPTQKYAQYSDIRDMVYRLAQISPFEIALGSGDVLTHPDFIKILELIRENNIVPNITLMTPTLLTTNKMLRQNIDYILKLCGCIAFSVGNTHDLLVVNTFTTYHQQFNHHNYNNKKFQMQIIPELKSVPLLTEIMTRSQQNYRLPITLLGLKYTGRAKDTVISEEHKANIGNYLKSYIRENRNYNISVDTSFMSTFHETLRDVLSAKTYYTEEGKFSCFIDCVDHSISKSSFDTEVTPLSENYNINEIINAYKTF